MPPTSTCLLLDVFTSFSYLTRPLCERFNDRPMLCDTCTLVLEGVWDPQNLYMRMEEYLARRDGHELPSPTENEQSSGLDSMHDLAPHDADNASQVFTSTVSASPARDSDTVWAMEGSEVAQWVFGHHRTMEAFVRAAENGCTTCGEQYSYIPGWVLHSKPLGHGNLEYFSYLAVSVVGSRLDMELHLPTISTGAGCFELVPYGGNVSSHKTRSTPIID